MLAKELECYTDLISLLPKIRDAVSKGIGLNEQLHEHDAKRIKIEINLFRDVFSILQKKWTIEIMYILRFSKQLYFNDIKRALPKINSVSLTSKLRSLEKRGIAEREVETETSPTRVKYNLTNFGNGLYEMLFPFMIYYILPKKYRV